MERNCILPIPDDLVQDILSRLKVRDLLRLRCVSKECCALIDNASFIMNHYHVQHYICKEEGNMPHFVYDGGRVPSDSEKFYFLSLQQGDVCTLDVTPDLDRDSKDLYIYARDTFRPYCVGCVNGIICLAWKHKNHKDFVGLWNPATREFKVVLYPKMPKLRHRSHFYIIGFGYDPLSNDFKILGSYYVRRGRMFDLSKTYYGVYSLRANSWKKIRGPPAGVSGAPIPDIDGYFNGVYYWTTEREERHLVIVSFHFDTEVFKVSDPPEEAISLASHNHPIRTMITLYKETVALVMCLDIQEVDALYSIDIWTVTQFDDCGVPMSWQHTFTIKPAHAKLGVDVDAFLIDGNLLLSFTFSSEESTTPVASEVDAECNLYNPSTGEYKKVGESFSAYYRYVESLFPLSRRLVQT